MGDELQKQPNKYLMYIKANKYNVYFTAAISILLFMIIVMIAITVNHKNTTQTNSITNTNQPQTISPTLVYTNKTPSPTTIQITTPDPTQAAIINSQTQPQITPAIAVPYTVSAIRQYGESWVLMKITNPDVGVAYVIVENINGMWNLKLGPGTHFDSQDLQNIGAPQEILNDANTGI